MRVIRILSIAAIFLVVNFPGYAQQDSSEHLFKRIQYPASLMNAHTGVRIGYMHYNFSQRQLEPGFSAGAIQIPPIGVGVHLYGHEIFHGAASVNVHYIRPVDWVKYKDVNGDKSEHSVWMNMVSFTLSSQLPISYRLFLTGEAGFAAITRKGFAINNNWAVRNAGFLSGYGEAGISYWINRKWTLGVSAAVSPANAKVKQPATWFYAASFRYTMRKLQEKKLMANKKSGFLFPKQIIQLGITTNAAGYGVNNFAYKKSPVPFFWGGAAEVKSGFAIHYHRNIFHTRKIFAFDWGLSASFFKTRLKEESFFALAAFPVLRFIVVRSKAADGYFYYSVAGPAYISKTILDGNNTGRHFTFQDMLGIGSFIGKQKKLNAEIRIAHYSNGNIFPENDGVKVPLSFCLGYCF